GPQLQQFFQLAVGPAFHRVGMQKGDVSDCGRVVVGDDDAGFFKTGDLHQRFMLFFRDAKGITFRMQRITGGGFRRDRPFNEQFFPARCPKRHPMVLFAMFHFDGHRNRLLSYSDSSWSHHYTGFAREKKPALQQFHTLATDWTQEFSSWRSCPNHGTFYYNKNTKTDARRCKGGRRVGHKTKAGMVTETSLFQQLLRQK